jgi:outer membrane protein TolC
MKTNFSYVFLFIFVLFFSGINLNLNAQEENNTELIDPTVDISKLSTEDYSNLVLPPLSVFLDAVENTNKVGSLKATKEEEEGNLITAKREWMNSFRAVGNYQYGKIAAYATTSGTSVSLSDELQHIYDVGASISLPLDVIYDRKNRIKKQEARVKKADYDIQQAIDDLKTDVAETYINAIQQLNTLKAKAESVVIANADVELSKTNFMNGNLQLSDFNYRKSLQVTAITSFETTKAELNKAILHLELLTHVKILKKQ